MSKTSCHPYGAGDFYPEDSPLIYGKPGLSVQHGHIVRMQNPGKLLIGPLHAGCYNSSRPIWKRDENAGHLRGTGRIQDSDISYSPSAGGKHHKLLLATSYRFSEMSFSSTILCSCCLMKACRFSSSCLHWVKAPAILAATLLFILSTCRMRSH